MLRKVPKGLKNKRLGELEISGKIKTIQTTALLNSTYLDKCWRSETCCHSDFSEKLASSSSSWRHVDSTDLLDSLSLTIWPSWPSLHVSPLDGTQCQQKRDECNFFWLANTNVTMCWSPLKNFASEFVLTSSAVPSRSSSF